MAKKSNNNDKSHKGAAGKISQILQQVPIYRDALQPAVKKIGTELKPAGVNVGKAITTVTDAINVVLAPLRGLVWGYQQVEEIVFPALADRFKNKLHQLVSPPLTVAGPTVEALRFAGSEPSLRDMYVNLLATSMDKDATQHAHPSFVEIIRQLTPDEARLLKHIASSEHYTYHAISIQTRIPDKFEEYRPVIRRFSDYELTGDCAIQS